MDINALWDPVSAAIVLGGTVLATVLRRGVGDIPIVVRLAYRSCVNAFDYRYTRAEIATQIAEIQRHGLLKAAPKHLSDGESRDIIAALLRHRSLEAASACHAEYRAKRTRSVRTARDTLEVAAELAPIFGLAGTLLALSQLPASGMAQDQLMGAIGTAVISTLYGLLAAHLILLPLSAWIAQLSESEEADRQRLFDWLSAELSIEKRAERCVPPVPCKVAA
ncbi:MAG: MotA/TolQ/ExbB proton channel family protein [Pontixanthobacter sp.]